jgi:PleD family two-component response regulator
MYDYLTIYPNSQPEESTPTLPSVEDSMQTDTKGRLILLIENNTEVLATTADTLSRAGFKTVQCANGNSAMTAIEQKKPIQPALYKWSDTWR